MGEEEVVKAKVKLNKSFHDSVATVVYFTLLKFAKKNFGLNFLGKRVCKQCMLFHVLLKFPNLPFGEKRNSEICEKI